MSGLSVTYLSNWVLGSQKYSGAKYSLKNDLAKDKENMGCTQHHADKIITELHCFPNPRERELERLKLFIFVLKTIW